MLERGRPDQISNGYLQSLETDSARYCKLRLKSVGILYTHTIQRQRNVLNQNGQPSTGTPVRGRPVHSIVPIHHMVKRNDGYGAIFVFLYWKKKIKEFMVSNCLVTYHDYAYSLRCCLSLHLHFLALYLFCSAY